MLKRGLAWVLTTALVVFLMFRVLDQLEVSIVRGSEQRYVVIGGVAVAVFLLFWLAGGPVADSAGLAGLSAVAQLSARAICPPSPLTARHVARKIQLTGCATHLR